ncbi:MAG: hypothetical protein KC502_10745 [Myxococcales bacterium]|nr:hypothetical protein [Myxococcales bacterium]
MRAKIAAALKHLELSRTASATRQYTAEIQALFRGPHGPALARLALLHNGEKARIAALQAATELIGRHPRLAGFVAGDLTSPNTQLAQAAVRMSLAARCDTPALYAMTGLEHVRPAVRRVTIRGVLLTAGQFGDRGLMQILAKHIETTEKKPSLRALFARGVGLLGWAPAEPTLRQLLRDKAPVVRAEATVALARITGVAPPTVLRLAKGRSAVGRLAAIRALAAVTSSNRAITQLRALRKDNRRANDPLGIGPALVVGASAKEGLAWHGPPNQLTSSAAERSGSSR